MKSVASLLLLATLLPALATAGLASKILAKDPSLQLPADASAEADAQVRSSFDLGALQRLSTSVAPTGTKPPGVSGRINLGGDGNSSPAPKLAEIVKSRRLNQQALNDPPAIAELTLSHPRSTGIPQFDDALFSVDTLHLQGSGEETLLKTKIQEIAGSLDKFRSANLRYLNSIDIERKNAQLFTEAQDKVKVELESFRRQLDTVREKAASVKAEKNAAVLELEDLVNKRTAKLREVSDLTAKNDALNGQYAEVERQIALAEQGDKDIEGQIAGLTARQDALKTQFDDLTKQYTTFKSEKRQATKLVGQNRKEKETLAGKLDSLKAQIRAEAPLNAQLLSQAADIDRETAQLDAQVLKYQQEAVQLDRQLSQLDQMKAAAQRNLNEFGAKIKSQEDLRQQLRDAQEQARRKQTVLSDFEHDIRFKERSCRCSRRQLARIYSEKEVAEGHQQAIQGLMTNIQAINPVTTNMKLLGSIIEPPLVPGAALSPQRLAGNGPNKQN